MHESVYVKICSSSAHVFFYYCGLLTIIIPIWLTYYFNEKIAGNKISKAFSFMVNVSKTCTANMIRETEDMYWYFLSILNVFKWRLKAYWHVWMYHERSFHIIAQLSKQPAPLNSSFTWLQHCIWWTHIGSRGLVTVRVSPCLTPPSVTFPLLASSHSWSFHLSLSLP